jgi:hypothetical protein
MIQILADVRAGYEREMQRGIRQRDLSKAHDALVGQEAVDRIQQCVKLAEHAERERLAAIERDLRRAFQPRKADRPHPATPAKGEASG